MDKLEQWFLDGIKPEDTCLDILNWYRNLYYKESKNTERGVIAWAINDLFMMMREDNYRGDK